VWSQGITDAIIHHQASLLWSSGITDAIIHHQASLLSSSPYPRSVARAVVAARAIVAADP
jgi:hypothetical protein